MQKVKFFESKSPYDLQKEINNFAEKHDIINISYSTSERLGIIWHYCCVLYIENNK